jgi:hypothetical protein
VPSDVARERLPPPLLSALAEVRRELDLAEHKTEPGQPERTVDLVLWIAVAPLPPLDRECGVRPVVAIHRVSGESELPLNLLDILPFEEGLLQRELTAWHDSLLT